MHTLSHDPTDYKTVSPIERLSDRLRWPALPWPVRRLMRRHGLHAATAATIAELIGYTGGCQ